MHRSRGPARPNHFQVLIRHARPRAPIHHPQAPANAVARVAHVLFIEP